MSEQPKSLLEGFKDASQLVQGFAALVALLVTFTGIVFGIHLLSPGPTTTTTLPSPSTTSPSPPTTSPSPPTTAPGPASVFVDSLQRQQPGGGRWTFGAVNASGSPFTDGVAGNTLGTFGATDPFVIDFTVRAGFAHFRTAMGVDPTDAPGFQGSIGVNVLFNGQQIVHTVISRGSPICGIDAPLSGGGTLEFQVYFESGEPLTAVFGDARITRGTDPEALPPLLCS